ncbi:MAG: Maf-like protein [Bdellovibrionaceae bacterium]|nr:Maf-like protein [Pseudobdellovibrionaceae bacterium]
MKKIVLASTSLYRQQQLATLGIPFESVKPLFDEDRVKHQIIDQLKHPHAIAQKLSLEKGLSLADPKTITISGDQLVSLEGQILGKPGTIDNAIKQLALMQGKTHELVTACTVFDGRQPIEILNITQITLKPLSTAQIKTYVNLDQPVDCAGSYKIEKHGIQLVESVKSDDFTAIQGLPLLALAKVLNSLNITIPYLDGKHD